MAITDWPKPERPREKLLAKGAEALSDAELLAIFLRTGSRGKTAVDLARSLLQDFGGLRKLFTAKANSFCDKPGLGPAKYSQLQAALEIGRRYLQENLYRTEALTNANLTCQYLTARLRHYEHEVFACLFLDTHYRVIAFQELFHGSINNATIHPRELIREVLAYNAAAVILAHNHPSGIALPSRADKELTHAIVEALELIEVRVLDHIIIGDGDIASFAKLGLLS